MTSDPLPRVLFDTSVLFGHANRVAITRLADTDRPPFVALWSEWVVAELHYALAWRWAERCVDQGRPIDTATRHEMADAAKQMLT